MKPARTVSDVCELSLSSAPERDTAAFDWSGIGAVVDSDLWQLDAALSFSCIVAANRDGFTLNPEQHLGRPIFSIVCAEHQPLLQDFFANFDEVHAIKTIEFDIAAESAAQPPRTVFAKVMRCSSGNAGDHFLGAFTDITPVITQHRALELALATARNSAAQLDHLQNITQLGSWVYQRTSKRLVCSPQLFCMFGLTGQGITPEAFDRLVHPDDIDMLRRTRRFSAKQRQSATFTHRLLLGTHIKVVEQRWQCVCDEAGRLQSLVGTVQDVTDKVALKTALGEQEERYKAIYESCPTPVQVGVNRRIMDANLACAEMFGFDSVQSFLVHDYSTLTPELQPDGRRSADLIEANVRAAREFGFIEFDWMHLTVDGEPLPCRVHVRQYDNIDETGFIATITDLRDRRRMEALEGQVLAMFNNMAEGMMITNGERTLLAVNQAFTDITGMVADEVIGKPITEMPDRFGNTQIHHAINASLDKHSTWDGVVDCIKPSGEGYRIKLQIMAIPDQCGGVRNYLSVFSDITETSKNEELIAYLRHFDYVTDLPNANTMRGRLQKQMEAAEMTGKALACCCLDIDGFRRFISVSGYDSGDKVLKAVGQWLLNTIDPELNICRLTADTFVFSKFVDDQERYQVSLQRLQRQLRDGLAIVNSDDGEPLALTCSIGLAFRESEATDPNEFIANAESAMREAKKIGVGKLAFYRREMTEQLRQSLALELALYEALKCDEFVLHFQPKVRVGQPQICSFEALIRWQRNGRLVYPGEFMPTVEASDLVNDVTVWVLDAALGALASWQSQVDAELKVAVNLSSAAVLAGILPAAIKGSLARYGLKPSQLSVEILENVLFSEPQQALKEIQRIRDLGVQICLDDFGTGFSSLSYLRRFPIDLLKIDRQFIAALDEDPDSITIVRSTILMAHSMGIQVVAEGVETDHQLQLLASLQCDLIQGYRLSKPLPADAALDYYVSHQQGFDHDVGSLLHHCVLVVDDCEQQRLTLRLQLEREGFYVLDAADAEQALALLRSQRVVAVIADYMMPSMNGIEFLAMVAAEFSSVKRVLISGDESQSMLAKAINDAGISGFLPKPWKLKDLTAIMR